MVSQFFLREGMTLKWQKINKIPTEWHSESIYNPPRIKPYFALLKRVGTNVYIYTYIYGLYRAAGSVLFSFLYFCKLYKFEFCSHKIIISIYPTDMVYSEEVSEEQ